MKNQYFGDIWDLFKYDLIQRIMEEINSLQRFTFIPILTEYESKKRDGNNRNFDQAKKYGRPGTNNEELTKFLKKYKEIDPNQRDFTEIDNYLKSFCLTTFIHKGQDNKYFDGRTRNEYFNRIPDEYMPEELKNFA